MTVIVTGASGLVGGAVVRGLRTRGTPVITVAGRDPGFDSQVHHVDWDLREEAPVDVTALAPRVTAVVHCARLSADWGAAADFHDVNVAGTRRVLDAFPRARIVHLSSTAVYGPHRDHARLYEEAGPLEVDEYRDEFARTAALAEGVLTRVRPDALVLRPARLYAPGEADGVLDALARFSRRGVLTLPDGAKNRTMLAHLDTVVAAVVAGLDRPRVSGPVNVADPRPYVLHEAINTYIARTDHPHMTLDSRPADLARARAWIAQKRVKAPTATNRPAHTLTEIEAYVRERTYDLSRLRSLLGIEPEQRLAPQD
ncbi:MAG TPA: NAD-dependent epimerase/dehydratase family protein [Brevibacterium sp.]|nr:NAD-dependent epimerase/dehydratase family protein [Brevibacterium sp.]